MRALPPGSGAAGGPLAESGVRGRPQLELRFVSGRKGRQPPRTWVESGEWPNSRLAADAPRSVALAQGMAARLRAALEGSSARKAAKAAEVSPTTVTGIANGTTWSDVDTIARLESALDADLWGDEHRGRQDQNG